MNDPIVGSAGFPEPGREERGGVEGAPVPVREEEPGRKAVLEQKQFVTGRISETVRYIGFGLLAIFYVLVSSESVFSKRIVAAMPDLLIWMAVFASVAIFLDYLQYVFGSIAVDRALAQTGEHRNKFNKRWLVYRARGWCFWAKQLFTGVACAMLIAILLKSI